MVMRSRMSSLYIKILSKLSVLLPGGVSTAYTETLKRRSCGLIQLSIILIFRLFQTLMVLFMLWVLGLFLVLLMSLRIPSLISWLMQGRLITYKLGLLV